MRIRTFGLLVFVGGIILTLWSVWLIVSLMPPPSIEIAKSYPRSRYVQPNPQTPPPPEQQIDTFTKPSIKIPKHATSDMVPRITYESQLSSEQLWSGSWFHPDETKWKRCSVKPFHEFPNLGFYKERPVIVYTWHTLENFLYIHQDSVLQCPVKCLFISDLNIGSRCLDEVDSFIFHVPTMNRKPPKKKLPYQYWALFSTESELNYPILNAPEFRTLFDINMTYHLSDQVPFTYFISMDYYIDYYPLIWPKPEKVPVMMMISNCQAKNKRNEYLQELMKYIPIDSYGKCMNNKGIPKEMDSWPWYEVKWNLTSRYKFVISFENSIGDDYVSEKLFHSFIAGSVPVYWGAPNIDDFLPSPKSIIKMTDFKSPKDLASHLIYLNENDNAYKEYIKWKVNKEIQPSFYQLENTSPRTGPCRLCLEVARRQRNLFVEESGQVSQTSGRIPSFY